jgi:WD40 repeat protein
VKVFTEAGGRFELTETWTGHSDWVYGVAASLDGTRVASASGDGTVKLWNVADGKLLATFVQVTPGADDWVTVSGPGYYDASKPDAVHWQATDLAATPEQLDSLHNADLLHQSLAGKSVPSLKLQPKAKEK